MNEKAGKTYYYEGNSEGIPGTEGFYFKPPFGVCIMAGAVKKVKKEIPWDNQTRFYECLDIETGKYIFGTSAELAIKIDTSQKIVKTKAKTEKLYRDKYLINEIGIEEFLKETGRFKQEIEVYA